MRGRKNERKFLRGERVPRADQTLQSGTLLSHLKRQFDGFTGLHSKSNTLSAGFSFSILSIWFKIFCQPRLRTIVFRLAISCRPEISGVLRTEFVL